MNLLIMLAVAAVVLWLDYEVQQAPLLNDLDPYPVHPEAPESSSTDPAPLPTHDP